MSRAGIRDDFELPTIVMAQHRHESQRSRVIHEIRRDVAHDDAFLRIMTRSLQFPARKLRSDPVPPFTPHGLMRDKIGILQKIHREYLLEHHVVKIRLEHQRPVKKLKRGGYVSLRGMT